MQVQEDLEKDKCHTSNSGSLGDGIESKGQENFRMLLLRSSGLFEFVMTSMNDFVILKKWGKKKANSSATSSRKPPGLM